MSDPTTHGTDPAEPGRSKAGEAAEDTRRAAENVASDVRKQAEETAANVRDTARSRAEGAKNSVADEVSGVASALRTAADELRSGSPQERTFGQIAEGLADASEAMRRKDLGEMAADLSDFARRNPLVFLGGAALAGFAATRFAKAGSRPTRGSYGPGRSGDDPYSDIATGQEAMGASPVGHATSRPGSAGVYDAPPSPAVQRPAEATVPVTPQTEDRR